MPEGGGIGEFLNPKSMFTPGAAGGITLMLTNTLGANFGLPLAWTALAISAIIGSLVLVSGVPVLQRIVFYVLNSLVIFCVAMGSNSAGRELGMRQQSELADVVMQNAKTISQVQTGIADQVAKSIGKSATLTQSDKKVAIEQAAKGVSVGFEKYASEIWSESAKNTGTRTASKGAPPLAVSRGFFKEWSF